MKALDLLLISTVLLSCSRSDGSGVIAVDHPSPWPETVEGLELRGTWFSEGRDGPIGVAFDRGLAYGLAGGWAECGGRLLGPYLYDPESGTLEAQVGPGSGFSGVVYVEAGDVTASLTWWHLCAGSGVAKLEGVRP